MTYDAVSAYTVLFGDGDGPATVTVHGTAEDAWSALDRLVHRRRVPRWGRAVSVDETRVRAAAERWRRDDPERRFWQLAPHRLQVTVPVIARSAPPARTQ